VRVVFQFLLMMYRAGSGRFLPEEERYLL
jgi:hypothetical protein